MTPLFQRILGPDWERLPAAVRRFHSGGGYERFSGLASVERGTGWYERGLAAVFGFPQAGDAVSVSVTIERRGVDTEIWERNFAGRRYRSHQTASATMGHALERMGVFTFELALPFDGDAVTYPVRRAWLLGLPWPSRLLPRSETREFERDGRYQFDISLYAPLTDALIVSYRGWLEPDGSRRP